MCSDVERCPVAAVPRAVEALQEVEQALRVLRDVFRCEPGDLAVVLVREDDGWGEDDEVLPLPGG